MKKWYLKSELNDLLEYRLISFVDLSKKTGIHRNTFTRIKGSNSGKIRPVTLKIIADALKVKIKRDDNGIYFYEEDTKEIEKVDSPEDMAEIISILEKMNPRLVKQLKEITLMIYYGSKMNNLNQ